MTIRSILSFLSGYRGRRNWGFSYQHPSAARPRVRVRIQVGGQEFTQ